MTDEHVTDGGIAGETGSDGGLMDGIADEPQEMPGGMAEDPKEGPGDNAGGDAKTPPGESGGSPEAWELSVPKDFPLPAENLSAFTARARELGLTKAQAEGMLQWHRDFHGDVTREMARREETVLRDWNREMEQDGEFGGGHLKATIADARRALAVFDPDGGLRALLRDSKYQNHPAVIRAVARVGRALGEHAFVTPGGTGGGRDIPLEERMYPNMNV